MATRPVTCPTTSPEGFKFDRNNLVLDSNAMTNPEVMVMLGDIIFDAPAYSRFTINLKESACALISQGDISDDSGFVSFIIIKATYPANTVQKDKYVTWEYRGETYYMGEIMILSGSNVTTVDSEEFGWNLTKPGPVYQDGGIVVCNPHSNKKVKLEILVCR